MIGRDFATDITAHALAELLERQLTDMGTFVTWAFIAAAVGMLVGVREVRTEFRSDALTGILSWMGIGYIAVRIFLPVLTFVALMSMQVEHAVHPVLVALGCGLGWEFLLHVRFEKKEEGKTVYRGIRLAEWYQDMFLDEMRTRVEARREKCANELVPDGCTLDQIHTTVMINSPRCAHLDADVIERLTSKRNELDQFASGRTSSGLSEDQIEGLPVVYAYHLARLVDRRTLGILLEFTVRPSSASTDAHRGEPKPMKKSGEPVN